MAIERLKDNPSSTLSSGVDNSTDPVTVSVASASTFPTDGNFRIIIDSEILKVTAVSGNDFTATRAQAGTSIASHSSGATVRLIITDESLRQLIDDRFGSGAGSAYNSTSVNSFKEYQCTDAPFLVHNRAFAAYCPYQPIYEYDPTGWTWFNQSTSTITKDTPFSSRLVIPSGTGNIRGLITTFTAGNNVDCWVQPTATFGASSTALAMGICLANNSDAKQFNFWMRWRNVSGWPTYDVNREYWSASTTFGGGSTAQLVVPAPMMLRIDDNGSGTASLQYSFDGINFNVHESYNYSGNFTANRCGIVMFNSNGAACGAHFWNFRTY